MKICFNLRKQCRYVHNLLSLATCSSEMEFKLSMQYSHDNINYN